MDLGELADLIADPRADLADLTEENHQTSSESSFRTDLIADPRARSGADQLPDLRIHSKQQLRSDGDSSPGAWVTGIWC